MSEDNWFFGFVFGALIVAVIMGLYYQYSDESQSCPEGYKCEKIIEEPCYEYIHLEGNISWSGIALSNEAHIGLIQNGTEIPRCEGKE